MGPEATSGANPSKEDILDKVKQVLQDMTSDWDLEFGGGIAGDTHIISDLEFESIDVVQFIVQIEENFQRKDLPFEKLLMVDGRYRDDITVDAVVGFLHQYL